MYIERDEEEIDKKENEIFENLLKESCDIEKRRAVKTVQTEETLTWAQLRARRASRWTPLGQRYVRLFLILAKEENNMARRSLLEVLSDVMELNEAPVVTTSSSTQRERQQQRNMASAKNEVDVGDATMTQDAEPEEVADTDTIIDKINSIRAGKSFKDDAIRSQFEKYVNRLSDAESKALLAFLKGISQITSGEVPAKQATNPQDKPSPGLEIKQTNDDSNTKKIKPVVVKTPAKSSNSKENTKPPAPITAKRRELQRIGFVFSQRGWSRRAPVTLDRRQRSAFF